MPDVAGPSPEPREARNGLSASGGDPAARHPAAERAHQIVHSDCGPYLALVR